MGPIDEKSGESGFYCYVNRNKKGATLNLKSEKGKQMFYDLVKDADILVENYRGGVTKKLGIDYETVKKNQSIHYLCILFRIWTVWTINTLEPAMISWRRQWAGW